MSIERGRDPRDYALVAFGGAGPLHACALARALGLPRVIVPRGAGVASAIGLLEAERNLTVSLTRTIGLDGPEAASELAGLFAGLEARARELIGGSGGRPIAWQRHAHLRYAGQGFELRVAIPAGPIDDEFPARAREAFDSRYEAEYGYAQRDEPAEGTDWFLTGGPGGDPAPASASGPTGGPGRDARTAREDVDSDPQAHPDPDPDPDPPRSGATGEGGRAGGSARPAPIGTVTAWLADAPAGSGGAWADWPVFDRDGLRPGDRLAGPAIVAERESTTLLPAGDTARVSGEGNLLIDISAREGSTPP